MRFGPVPLDEAGGAVLAHSLQLGAKKLRKGRVLDADDIDAMRAEGLNEVIVARLDTGDLAEDPAAQRIADAMVPDPDAVHLRMTKASTGHKMIGAMARVAIIQRTIRAGLAISPPIPDE